MGSLVMFRAVLVSDVAINGTFTVPYPSGYSQATLTGSIGGQLTITNNEPFYQGIGVAFSFDASVITIQNTSTIVWPKGSYLRIGVGVTNRKGSNNLVPGSVWGTAAQAVGTTFPDTGGGSPGPVADPTRFMFASTRSGWPLLIATPTSAQVTRVSLTSGMSPDYPVNGLVFPLNWFGIDTAGAANPEVAVGNGGTLNGLTLVIGGVYYPVTYPSTTFVDGGTLFNTPLYLPADIPARTPFSIITVDSVPAGQNQPGGWTRQSQNGERSARASAPVAGWLDGSVAVPNNTGLTGGVNSTLIFGPCTMLAQKWDGRPVGYLVGDSMAAAATDDGSFVGASGVRGWLARGMDSILNGAQRYAHMNGCVTGTRPSGMSSLATGQYAARGAAIASMQALNNGNADPFTFWLSEHINNDASAYPTSNPNAVSQLTGVMQTFWAFMASLYPRSRRVQTSAFNACTSDSSAWSTFAGQSYRTTDADPTAGGARTVVSIAYETTLPIAYLDAVINQRSIVMNTTLWKYLPGDWTGTLSSAYTSGSTSVIVTGATAPIIGDNIVVDINISDYTQPQLISNVTGSGPWTITLFAPLISVSTGLTQAYAAGSPCSNSVTQDGLHEPPRRHQILADQAIVPAKLAGTFGTGATPPVGSAPVNTVAPVISGSSVAGGTLNVNSGTWSGSPTSFAYQRKENGVPVSGATGTSFTSNPATDVGKSITWTVTATNANGSTSITTAPVVITSSGGGGSHTFDSTAITFDSNLVTFDMT